MQKIINVVAAGTFVLALANTAVIVLAVTRGPSMVKKHISDIKLELTETLTQMVPTQIEGLCLSSRRRLVLRCRFRSKRRQPFADLLSRGS